MLVLDYIIMNIIKESWIFMQFINGDFEKCILGIPNVACALRGDGNEQTELAPFFLHPPSPLVRRPICTTMQLWCAGTVVSEVLTHTHGKVL
jgi:hypothetical protein